MKIIAFYLPQFHTFPENDEWWGKGFTEWTSVRKATPLYKGHNQPRVPYNNNYYDLTDKNALIWQSQLAKQYGIYGFCYYHYWFDGKMLMNKPMELMLKTPEIETKFCICWANENWTRQWAKKSKEVLISQTYGDKEDWKRHFEYFLPFFKDKRYIKKGNKPLIIIYRPKLISTLEDMIALWNKMAIENGFDGIYLGYQHPDYCHVNDENGELFDFGIEYQPAIAQKEELSTIKGVLQKGINILANKVGLKPNKFTSTVLNYDAVWNRIINRSPIDDKMYPGAFVDWDNTPRYGRRSSLYGNVTPDKFQYYLERQIQNAVQVYKKDMLFCFAWNEWGEGGYLEPDTKWGYGMLEAVRNALNKTGQWENSKDSEER